MMILLSLFFYGGITVNYQTLFDNPSLNKYNTDTTMRETDDS